jgi:hypothetical protein
MKAQEKEWSDLWKIEVPSKIRVFFVVLSKAIHPNRGCATPQENAA